MPELTETQIESAQSLFDDMRDDAAAGTAANSRERIHELLQSILSLAAELQRLVS